MLLCETRNVIKLTEKNDLFHFHAGKGKFYFSCSTCCDLISEFRLTATDKEWR